MSTWERRSLRRGRASGTPHVSVFRHRGVRGGLCKIDPAVVLISAAPRNRLPVLGGREGKKGVRGLSRAVCVTSEGGGIHLTSLPFPALSRMKEKGVPPGLKKERKKSFFLCLGTDGWLHVFGGGIELLAQPFGNPSRLFRQGCHLPGFRSIHCKLPNTYHTAPPEVPGGSTQAMIDRLTRGGGAAGQRASPGRFSGHACRM